MPFWLSYAMSSLVNGFADAWGPFYRFVGLP
jgi:hypothetical protein